MPERSSTMQRAVELLAYPTFVASALPFGLLLLGAGLGPGVAVAVASVVYMLVAWGLEVAFPETPHWKVDRGEVQADFLHMLISNTIPAALFRALFFGLIVGASDAISGVIGIGLWPQGWPIVAQFLLCVAVAELTAYTIHRGFHESRLWPVHAVHHCSPHMYVLISVRKHPIQAFFTYGGRLAVLWFLGVPGEVIALQTILAAANSSIQHANVHMKTGFLGWIFATPEIHRIHHSRRPSEFNANYGDVLIVWDVLFGTRIPPDPADPHHESLGIPGVEVAQTYASHLKLPFEWGERQGSDP